jgi:hypothetical protein
VSYVVCRVSSRVRGRCGRRVYQQQQKQQRTTTKGNQNGVHSPLPRTLARDKGWWPIRTNTEAQSRRKWLMGCGQGRLPLQVGMEPVTCSATRREPRHRQVRRGMNRVVREDGRRRDKKTTEPLKMCNAKTEKNIDVPSGDCTREPAGVGCDLQSGSVLGIQGTTALITLRSIGHTWSVKTGHTLREQQQQQQQ